MYSYSHSLTAQLGIGNSEVMEGNVDIGISGSDMLEEAMNFGPADLGKLFSFPPTREVTWATGWRTVR